MESSLELIEGRWATGPLAAPLLWVYTSSSASQSPTGWKKNKLIISYHISQIAIIFCWRQRSAVAEIEFTCIWSFSGSLIEAPFASKCDVTVLVLVNINILDLVTHERKRTTSCFGEHLQKRGALGLFFKRRMSATCRRNGRMAPRFCSTGMKQLLITELLEKRK